MGRQVGLAAGLPDAPPVFLVPFPTPCPNACARSQHDRIIHNRHELHGHWAGWRFAGRDLVSPDGDRIGAERLHGMLFVESLRRRYAKSGAAKHGGTVRQLLPSRERFDGCA